MRFGFWVPLMMTVASIIVSLAIPALGINAPAWVPWAALFGGLILAAVTYWVAKNALNLSFGGRRPGAGGDAKAIGRKSAALGGAGGDGVGGGCGGDATAAGDGSLAVGGKGGNSLRRAHNDDGRWQS